MNIITCIKQVPGSSKVDVDPKTGVLIRDGSNVKMNPYDLYALETAYLIKEKYADTIVKTITMGPASAKKVLEESLYMGSDEAYLLSDRAFAGADVLATSYSISQMIRKLHPYDLIICGKQTTDGDTAQVGPEIAEFLGIPHVAYVTKIEEVQEDGILVRTSMEDHEEQLKISFPCLITVDKGTLVPRLPSFHRKQRFTGYSIQTFSLKDLEDKDPSHYGLEGSPTQVEEIFPPNKKRDSISIKGDKKTITNSLFEILKEKKYI